MKKIISILLALFFVMTTVGMAFAAENGNKRKGKYTYRKVYKACYEKGEVTSKKPILNPDAHTQAQWTRIFEKKKFQEFGCPEQWSALTEEELLDIYAYLHAHAADSPTPAKCK